jgi:hypothetical protein
MLLQCSNNAVSDSSSKKHRKFGYNDNKFGYIGQSLTIDLYYTK